MPFLSALTLVKLSVVLLGMFNVAILLKGQSSASPSPSVPRQIHITNDPNLLLLHLDIDTRTPLARTMITEESVRYPIQGPLADQDWASLVPEGNHGLVLLDTPDPESEPRPYAIAMFHTLHCLNRIRRAIVSPGSRRKGGGETAAGASAGSEEPPETPAQARFHAHHCLNYVRQMVLCAANTRLNPINHVLPSGKLATDGIGLLFECRDWTRVYDAFEANYALNRTMTFA